MIFAGLSAQNTGKHLFILSGQSNMARLDPDISFTPTLHAALGAEKVIVVKHAVGGQPMRRWYKKWHSPDERQFTQTADLYDSLMARVLPAIAGEKIASVTFVWMQGENDARNRLGNVYEESLLGLYKQIGEDLKRHDVRFVIGRLSDFGISNAEYPHWNMIREIEMRVAENNSLFAWIDTDDLNDGFDAKGNAISNDLHMSVEGYRIMGKRFAEAALKLLPK